MLQTTTNNKVFSTSPVAKSGDHSTIWSLERAVGAVLVPATVIPFVITNPITDGVFCTLAVLHSYWGLEAIVVDYVRPKLFGGSNLIPNITRGLVFGLHAFILGALFYFSYTDVGLVNAIKMFWKL
jgi:succinate dehydrogenase (ubiquinone) membrane anchor subunit